MGRLSGTEGDSLGNWHYGDANGFKIATVEAIAKPSTRLSSRPQAMKLSSAITSMDTTCLVASNRHDRRSSLVFNRLSFKLDDRDRFAWFLVRLWLGAVVMLMMGWLGIGRARLEVDDLRFLVMVVVMSAGRCECQQRDKSEKDVDCLHVGVSIQLTLQEKTTSAIIYVLE